MLHHTSAATLGHKPVCPGDFTPAGMRRMDLETVRGSLRMSRPEWRTENETLISFTFRAKIYTAYQQSVPPAAAAAILLETVASNYPHSVAPDVWVC